jgi:hypothetical protein
MVAQVYAAPQPPATHCPELTARDHAVVVGRHRKVRKARGAARLVAGGDSLLGVSQARDAEAPGGPGQWEEVGQQVPRKTGGGREVEGAHASFTAFPPPVPPAATHFQVLLLLGSVTQVAPFLLHG